jgi:hypothetical protein
MDVVMIPEALLTAYGFLVLASGGVLGFIAGRNRKKFRGDPTPPDLLGRRTDLLEKEFEATQAELRQLREEAEFLHRLLAPDAPEKLPREKPRSVA